MATALNPRLRDGIAAARARDFDRARALLEPLTVASPNDALAWFWLAIASQSAEAAIPYLRRVVEIDGSHVQAREALGKLLVTQAGTAATGGNRREARACATEATELTPDDAAAWLALASVSEDRAERLAALRRAFALNPQPATRTRLRRTVLYYAVMSADTDRSEARALFREAALLDPADSHVWQALVQLADTPAEALHAVREFVQAAPDDAESGRLLKKALAADARAHEAAGNAEAACERWREAAAIDPRDLDAWLALAAVTRDEDEARHALETAFEIDPSDERIAAAWRQMRDVPVDPAALEAPADAFAHLQPCADVFAGLDATPDAFAQFDLAADPFARFDAPANAKKVATAQPPVEPPVIVPEVSETPVEEPRPQPAAAAEEQPGPAEPLAQPAAPAADVIEPATPVTAATPPQERPAAAANRSVRRTVMVVDDSPTVRKILGLTLERAGFKVVAEPDGESAIERLIHVVPDVILLDIAMPKLDGYEVCKRIRSDPRTAHVPVVMLSGKDALFNKVKGHMAGATQYLTKPFEPPAVLAAVAQACQPATEVVDG